STKLQTRKARPDVPCRGEFIRHYMAHPTAHTLTNACGSAEFAPPCLSLHRSSCSHCARRMNSPLPKCRSSCRSRIANKSDPAKSFKLRKAQPDVPCRGEFIHHCTAHPTAHTLRRTPAVQRNSHHRAGRRTGVASLQPQCQVNKFAP